MPRYLHIPHTPDTARTLTLSGRNCLAVSGMTTPPLKSVTGAERGAEAKCVHKARRSPTAGLLRALWRVRASPHPPPTHRHTSQTSQTLMAGGLCLALKDVTMKPTDDVDVDKEYQLIPLDSL